MNIIKEKVLRESYNYRGSYLNEDYALSNMVKGFVEDYKEFGEETANLYKAMFMLGEDVRMDLLQENIEYITEMVENSKTPFLFESSLNNLFKLNEDYDSEYQRVLLKTGDVETAKKIARKAFPIPVSRSGKAEYKKDVDGDSGSIKQEIKNNAGNSAEQQNTLNQYGNENGMSSSPESSEPIKIPGPQIQTAQNAIDKAAPVGPFKPKDPDALIAGTTVTQGAMADASNAALAAPTPEAALKAASAVSSGPGSREAAMAAAGDKLAKNAPGPGPSGILGWISRAFRTVKNFFTGGVSSIGAAIKSGNWGALLQIPLVKGALVTGGAVLAFKLLKKLFGNKIKPNQEASLKAQLATQGR